ncbi:hypothetical protein DFH07DRAFT_756359 [Mycena maculata]|uniref:DUF6589 domain-containing protein n=1 Tax=Mycena maculata TaxID=230809 RepID=A0AAD7HXC6_9AGAR|nr:hypothetical protein DFH07DRAFT_756359 [Mycena maculata]
MLKDRLPLTARIPYEPRRLSSASRPVTLRADLALTALSFFFDALWRKGGDAVISSQITKYVQRHGAEHARGMFRRSREVKEEFVLEELAEIFQREGRAIQALLTWDARITVTELLKEFSMEQLAADIEAAAPHLWSALAVLCVEFGPSTISVLLLTCSQVFTTICALISVVRSQRANNFQLIIGLFFLGSGASKREMEVLAHAGLSISYTSILTHVKQLSREGLAKIRDVVKSGMVQLVWDNLNIAFKIAAQRLNAKSHFDNGTTSTMIPVFDPATGGQATHGTLPLEMKPPHERTLPVLDWSPEDVLPSPESAAQLSTNCFWQMKRMALEHVPGVTDKLKNSLRECPEVYQIPVHKTNQYPLPAMKEDESTLEGTLNVYFANLDVMGLDDEALEAHSLLFDDGDLLTDTLKEKLESARRNSTTPRAGLRASCRRWGIFHGQMAGGQLTINEHWGMPNSLWPDGLWWEHNKLLKRKPLMAGWGGKKATDWKPAHELIHISLPAHIVDGFRIYCRHESLSEWAKSATVAEFDRVAKAVFDSLFSTAALNELRARSVRDITLENTILYNCDALFYIEFTHAIKTGDIGRVLNVLAIWMVMMRSPKTMPRYADAMFETLVRIKSFPPKLRQVFFPELYLMNWLVNLTGRLFGFKPVDLLQEHQNFWAKIIYSAKGSNKSWKWLAMITVCIFTLREAMRTVQTTFKIPAYGEKHKTPLINEEVALIAQALLDEKIQTYVEHRPANDHVNPVRDLIKEGVLYADSSKAFRRFTRDTRKAERRGFDTAEGGNEGETGDENEEDGDEGEVENYDVTEEDLRMDDEEFLMEPGEILTSAMELVDCMLNSDMEDS